MERPHLNSSPAQGNRRRHYIAFNPANRLVDQGRGEDSTRVPTAEMVGTPQGRGIRGKSVDMLGLSPSLVLAAVAAGRSNWVV